VADYELIEANELIANELFRIHREAMTEYLEIAIPDWTEDAARANFDKWMDDGRAQAVVVRSKIAGCLDVERKDDAIWLNRIELSPTFQGMGVGTSIIRDLQAEASFAGVPVCLHVFPHNPATALYRRLGFEEVGREGPSIEMRWLPAVGKGADHQIS
jgi:ribosomal protein S18 acetylase RimI-like enzyme